MEHRHPVAQHERLLLVVGDEDGGDAEVDKQAVHLGTDLEAQGGVEVREGLVEQQDPRARGERPGQGYPLLLAARERAGHAVGHIGEADHGECLVDPAVATLVPGEPVGHVALDVEVGEQGAVLEDHANPPSLGGYEVLVVGDDAAAHRDGAVCGTLESCDGTQQRGLATAAGTEEGDEFAGGDLEGEVGEDGRAAIGD